MAILQLFLLPGQRAIGVSARMLPEPKRRIRFLTREEAERLQEALPAHLVPVIRYALATGCRMSEMLRLE